MSRILYAWELGGGFGHVAVASPLALALKRRNHEIELVLRDLKSVDFFLTPHGLSAWQAPIAWRNEIPNPASYAEILYGMGYHDPKGLIGIVRAWRRLFEILKPDMLLADHAPTALLAARGLSFPCATIGTGFYSPPRLSPIPSFRTWERVDPVRLITAEQRVLAGMNAVAECLGQSPFGAVSDLFAVDETFLLTWPELDHYPARGSACYRGPMMPREMGASPCWSKDGGKKIFGYLKADYLHIDKLLKGLRDCGRSTLIYLQGDSSGQLAARYRSPSLSIVSEPLSFDAVMHEADMVVCHAGMNTISAALLAGKPLLLAPMQAEQHINAQRVVALGCGISFVPELMANKVSTSLEQLLQNLSYTNHARNFASKYADFNPDEQVTGIVERVETRISHNEICRLI